MDEAMPLMNQLFKGARHDAQPSRRRGPGPGDLPERPYQKFRNYKPGTNIKAWLYRIPLLTYITGYRKAQRSNGPPPTVEDWQLAEAASHAESGLSRPRSKLSSAALLAAARGARFAVRGTPDGCPHGRR